MRTLVCLLMLLFVLSSCSQVPTETIAPTTAMETSTPEELDVYEQARQDLLEEIKAMGVKDEDVLRAMAAVPRHKFVPTEYLDQAYSNHPLPIGYGQTISQPYIVAWMTELLELQPGEKVLEIGTGSGYQAAILAELGYVDVYSVEIVPELADRAAKRLQELGYKNIHTKQGDGYYGWSEYAPFDAIIVTAAPDHLPGPLVKQLTEDGRIVIPIGPPGWVQSLWKFVSEDGELTAYNLGGVRFVSLTGPGTEQHQSEETSIP
jgi:protein-L-isoaspartate(D-aspartate) O-methyltransferase